MAGWGAARRAADLCVMGAARQATPFACISVRKGLQFIPLRPNLSLETSVSSTLCTLAAFSEKREKGLQSISLRPKLSLETSIPSTMCTLVAFSEKSEKSFGFPRPDDIFWKKELVNNVSLIGRVNETVSINYLDSGNIVAGTSIRVQRDNSPSYSEFALQFWEELAEIAAAHLKKDDYVYVSGSLWVENYMARESEQKSICKVVCKDVKFVSHIDEPSNVSDNTQAEMKLKDAPASEEELWRCYFQNPMEYWDNRLSKKNPRSPDFKHKESGASLWLSNIRTPSWVHEKLAQEPSNLALKGEKGKEIKQLWQEFFADPSDWWDNRKNKRSSRSPDFKSKSTGDALWIDSSSTPAWVKPALELLDSKTTSSRDGRADRASGLQKTSMSTAEDEDLMFF